MIFFIGVLGAARFHEPTRLAWASGRVLQRATFRQQTESPLVSLGAERLQQLGVFGMGCRSSVALVAREMQRKALPGRHQAEPAQETGGRHHVTVMVIAGNSLSPVQRQVILLAVRQQARLFGACPAARNKPSLWPNRHLITGEGQVGVPVGAYPLPEPSDLPRSAVGGRACGSNNRRTIPSDPLARTPSGEAQVESRLQQEDQRAAVDEACHPRRAPSPAAPWTSS